MTQSEYDQNEYKKLLTEYDELKSDNPQNTELEEKVKKLTEKHKEIQDLSSKLF